MTVSFLFILLSNDEVYHAVSAANGVDTTDWI